MEIYTADERTANETTPIALVRSILRFIMADLHNRRGMASYLATPGGDFLNDAPFEDLEKILEILGTKYRIFYTLNLKDTDSEVLSNLSRAVVENSEGK